MFILKKHSLPGGSLKDSGDNLTSPFQRGKLPLRTFLFFAPQEKQKKIRILIILGLLLMIKQVEGGLDQPIDKQQLLTSLYGTLCDCQGDSQLPPPCYYQSTDCGDKTAYLGLHSSTGGFHQNWVCVSKPKPLPALPDDKCPKDCTFVDQMNAICYTSFTMLQRWCALFYCYTLYKIFGLLWQRLVHYPSCVQLRTKVCTSFLLCTNRQTGLLATVHPYTCVRWGP